MYKIIIIFAACTMRPYTVMTALLFTLCASLHLVKSSADSSTVEQLAKVMMIQQEAHEESVRARGQSGKNVHQSGDAEMM